MKKKGFLALIGLVLGVMALLYTTLLPRIESLESSAFEPGGTVLIMGKNFGPERNNSYVSLGGSPLSISSYRSWDERAVEVAIPLSLDSGLLRVITSFGKSNPFIIIAKPKVPIALKTEASDPASPKILSLSAAESEIGSLLEIQGLNFGLNMQFSALRFSRNPGALDLRKAQDFLEITYKDGFFEGWNDKRIAVRIPEGVGSGMLTVLTPQGESAPFPYAIRKASGSKYLFAPVVYSAEYEIQLKIALSVGEGYVLVYAPDPVDSGSQSLDEIQDQTPAAYFKNYGPATVFRVDQPGRVVREETSIRRTFLVTVASVETELGSYREEFKDGKIPEFLKPYVQANQRLPVGDGEIASLAGRIVGRERNPHRKAVAIWSWLKKNIKWLPSGSGKEDLSVFSALSGKKASTRQLVYLASTLFRAAGVPCVPISGFLIRKDGTSIPHSWMEYYLPALGWVPFDPVLAMGEKPSDFNDGFQDRSHYLGSLDNRHLAISRDFHLIPSLLESPDKMTGGIPWSDQSLFEESFGIRYSSSWNNIRVLGEY